MLYSILRITVIYMTAEVLLLNIPDSLKFFSGDPKDLHPGMQWSIMLAEGYENILWNNVDRQENVYKAVVALVWKVKIDEIVVVYFKNIRWLAWWQQYEFLVKRFWYDPNCTAKQDWQTSATHTFTETSSKEINSTPIAISAYQKVAQSVGSIMSRR